MQEWIKVSKNNPCPVCGKPDWCAIHIDGAVVKCMRQPDGAFQTLPDNSGEAYFHRLTENNRVMPVSKQSIKKEVKTFTVEELEAILRKSQTTVSNLDALSATLKICKRALSQLEVGWLSNEELNSFGTKCAITGAYTFPMRNSEGSLCGFRLRSGSRKYALSGGHNGLFIPRNLRLGGTYFVVEGPTDTAAMLCYGRKAVGRPNNTANPFQIVEYLELVGAEKVNIIIDNDKPGSKAEASTLSGAKKLIQKLNTFFDVGVEVYKPKTCKDIREMLSKGLSLGEGLVKLSMEDEDVH